MPTSGSNRCNKLRFPSNNDHARQSRDPKCKQHYRTLKSQPETNDMNATSRFSNAASDFWSIQASWLEYISLLHEVIWIRTGKIEESLSNL